MAYSDPYKVVFSKPLVTFQVRRRRVFTVNRHSIVHYFRYIHTVLLVYCLYPLHNIVLCLSIFMTVALSMERLKGELFKEPL